MSQLSNAGDEDSQTAEQRYHAQMSAALAAIPVIEKTRSFLKVPDLVGVVAVFFALEPRLALRCVSSFWNAAVAATMQTFQCSRVLGAREAERIAASFFEIRRVVMLCPTALAQVQLAATGFSHFSHLVGLASLELTGFSLRNNSWTGICSIVSLTSLTLRNCKWVAADFLVANIERLQNLRVLCLYLPPEVPSAPSVIDVSLRAIGRLPQLSSLTLNGSCVITDNGVAALYDSFRLRSLDLSSCAKVSFEALWGVVRWTDLRHLDLSGTKLTDTGLACVVSLEWLTSLNVGGCAVSDAAVENVVGRLTRLTSLGMSGCYISDAVFEAVGRLTRLTSLDVSACTNVQGISLGDLGGAAVLQSLNLAHCCNLSAGSTDWGRLTSLRFLDVQGASFLNDVDLLEMQSLSNLATLNLAECHQISQVGVQRVVGACAQLTSLNVSGCPNVTSTDLAQLRQAERVRQLRASARTVDNEDTDGGDHSSHRKRQRSPE